MPFFYSALEVVDEDIAKMIKLFEQKSFKELPPYVSNVEQMKRPYFRGVLLPRLLKLNMDEQISKSKLVTDRVNPKPDL